MGKLKIGFVVSTSKRGGVETALVDTLRGLDCSLFEPFVCVTGECGPLHDDYRKWATVIGAGELYGLDVLNIYNHLAWSARFIDSPHAVDVAIFQHIYMHYDTLYWMHAAQGSYYALLRHLPAYKGIVCDSEATADRIKQDILTLRRMCHEVFCYPPVQKRTFPRTDIKTLGHRVSLVEHPLPESGDQEPREPSVFDAEVTRILWVGAPTWAKGFDRLAQIVKRFPQGQFTVVLKTVPDENTDSAYVEMYDELLGRSNVEVLRDISQTKMAELMAHCNTYLQTGRREGMPRTLLEAQAAGLVCVLYGPRDPDRESRQRLTELWLDQG